MTTQPSILHMDPEWSLRILIANELTRYGFTVHSAENGREAREIASRDLPIHAAVLSSTQKHALDPDLIDYMRSKHPGIGIIITAGGWKQATVMKYKKNFAIIQKPYCLIDLVETLEAAIKEKP